MNIFKTILTLLMLLCLAAAVVQAQTTIQSTGDGGAWDNPVTWEGGTVPGDLDSVIILSGDSVWVGVSDTCSGLNIEPGAKLATYAKLVPTVVTLNGTLTAYADTFFQSSTMTVGSTGIYNHAMNGGRIPSGVWETGSTVMITGLVGNGPSNGNQNFYNVIWNCPAQSANLNLAWNNNTIGGDITMKRSGTYPTFVRWNLTAPLTDSTANVTIMGNINVTRGAISSNGTSNGNTHINIYVHGNVNVNGEDPSRDSCNFSVGRGSQGSGSGTAYWYLYNNFTMVNAVTQNSNQNGAKFIFAKPGTQTLTLSGDSISSLPIQVTSGTTLNVGASQIKGNSKIWVDSAATVICSNAGGLDSAFQGTGAKTLHTASNYVFNGTSAQRTGRVMPDTLNTLTINNANGVTLSDTILVQSSLTLTNGDFTTGSKLVTLASAATLSETAGNTVVGTILTTRDVAQNTDESFGGLGLSINAAGATPGLTTVRRVTGTANWYYAHQSILRYFDITSATNTGLNATLDYYYDDSELNGQDASKLVLWKSNNSGSTWLPVSASVNTGLKRLSTTGVESFGRFTAADSANLLNVNSRTYTMNPAWNMVSLPLVVDDPQKTAVFPTAVSSAFEYANGYNTATTLESGKGYWLKFTGTQDVTMTGASIMLDTVHLTAGWNMIGTLSDSLDVSSITEIPNGIVESQYFGYNSGYNAVSKLAPSRGYWVKAGNSGGDIVLSSSGFAKSNSSHNNAVQQFNKITITDNRGYCQTLYLGAKPADGFNLGMYELPPSPPAGVMDVRYVSQRMVEVYQPKGQQAVEFPLSIQSASYPVKVQWDMKDDATTFMLVGASGIKQQMRGEGAMILPDEKARLSIHVSGENNAPKQFSLGENYPNPFNPSTVMRVELPVQSQLSLRIYSLLGEQVAEIASGVYDQGYYTFSWQGANGAGIPVSSGVYFYKMEATSLTSGQTFSAVHKMVLMK